MRHSEPFEERSRIIRLYPLTIASTITKYLFTCFKTKKKLYTNIKKMINCEENGLSREREVDGLPNSDAYCL